MSKINKPKNTLARLGDKVVKPTARTVDAKRVVKEVQQQIDSCFQSKGSTATEVAKPKPSPTGRLARDRQPNIQNLPIPDFGTARTVDAKRPDPSSEVAGSFTFNENGTVNVKNGQFIEEAHKGAENFRRYEENEQRWFAVPLEKQLSQLTDLFVAHVQGDLKQASGTLPQAVIAAIYEADRTAKALAKVYENAKAVILAHKANGGTFEGGDVLLSFGVNDDIRPAWKDIATKTAQELALERGDAFDPDVFVNSIKAKTLPSNKPTVKLYKVDELQK